MDSNWIDIGDISDIPLRGARCVKTPMGKIVEIRGKDTSGMDRADRDYYETLKERFALPGGLKGVKRNETLQEHEDAFLDRFG